MQHLTAMKSIRGTGNHKHRGSLVFGKRRRRKRFILVQPSETDGWTDKRITNPLGTWAADSIFAPQAGPTLNKNIILRNLKRKYENKKRSFKNSSA